MDGRGGKGSDGARGDEVLEFRATGHDSAWDTYHVDSGCCVCGCRCGYDADEAEAGGMKTRARHPPRLYKVDLATLYKTQKHHHGHQRRTRLYSHRFLSSTNLLSHENLRDQEDPSIKTCVILRTSCLKIACSPSCPSEPAKILPFSAFLQPPARSPPQKHRAGAAPTFIALAILLLPRLARRMMSSSWVVPMYGLQKRWFTRNCSFSFMKTTSRSPVSSRLRWKHATARATWCWR